MTKCKHNYFYKAFTNKLEFIVEFRVKHSKNIQWKKYLFFVNNLFSKLALNTTNLSVYGNTKCETLSLTILAFTFWKNF